MPQHGINERQELATAMTNLESALSQFQRALRASGVSRSAGGTVFDALREWRTGEAREKGLPPYIIATDAQLRAIEAAHPTDVAQLGAVKGLGENKVAAYGEAILRIVASGGAPLVTA